MARLAWRASKVTAAMVSKFENTSVKFEGTSTRFEGNRHKLAQARVAVTTGCRGRGRRGKVDVDRMGQTGGSSTPSCSDSYLATGKSGALPDVPVALSVPLGPRATSKLTARHMPQRKSPRDAPAPKSG